MDTHSFRGMNTDIAIWQWPTAQAPPGRLQEAEGFFERVEAELSRFLPTSGLCRLNAAAGTGPKSVSGLLLTVLSAALQAARKSGGIFDPTVLLALRQAGYDRSFEQVPQQSIVAPSGELPPCNWRGVRLNLPDQTVALPRGLGLDLGGIAKGWTVDQVAQMLAPWGPVLVDAGGDIRVIGSLPDQPWLVGVEHPFAQGRDLLQLELTQGGIATSSIGGRCWQRNGRAQHHLIDPRTSKPSTSDLHTVVVYGRSAREAEIAAKTALILGLQEGHRYLQSERLLGVLITRDRQIQLVGRKMQDKTRGKVAPRIEEVHHESIAA